MNGILEGKTVAILATDGVDQNDVALTRRALDQAGAITRVISPLSRRLRTWKYDRYGDYLDVDVRIEDATPEVFDALFLPGGVMNVDSLRTSPLAIAFVRGFFAAGKPVGALERGPCVLVEADVVADRRVTSYPSVRRNLVNAGANWVDEPVVVDRGLVTGRYSEDAARFATRLIEEIAEGIHPQAVDERLREGGDFVGGAPTLQPEVPQRHPAS